MNDTKINCDKSKHLCLTKWNGLPKEIETPTRHQHEMKCLKKFNSGSGKSPMNCDPLSITTLTQQKLNHEVGQ